MNRTKALGILLIAFVLYQQLVTPGGLISSAPIPAPGFKVALVSDPTDPLTLQQTTSASLLPELVKQAGGEFRRLQVNEPSPLFEDYWKSVLDRPRAQTPWLVVSNGDKNTGTELVLPDEATTRKLIEDYK
jgi:hypothetical protein